MAFCIYKPIKSKLDLKERYPVLYVCRKIHKNNSHYNLNYNVNKHSFHSMGGVNVLNNV